MRRIHTLLSLLLAIACGTFAAPMAESETTIAVTSDNGTFTKDYAGSSWACLWQSSTTPMLSISTDHNNMMNYGGGTDIQFYTNDASNGLSSTYTMSVGGGYVITGYSFSFTAQESAVTVTPDGGTAVSATTTAAGHVQVSGLNASSCQFTVSASAADFANTTAFLVTVAPGSGSVPAPSTNLFATLPGDVPYRIPAIAKGTDGTLCAVSDYRPCGSDIGYGRVDLHYRLSHDNGLTWGDEQVLVEGDGITGSPTCGYGDAALVADAESSRMLLICVTGNTPCTSATRQNPNRVARFYSSDNGRTWSAPEDITESIYTLFDASSKGPTQSLFFGSGRICQSRQVKVGDYYRLYAALWTQYYRYGVRTMGNRVIYSDDFGQTWHELGNDDVPAPGNEPKVEELPDGSVVLSSRTTGRYYNIFTYTDKAAAQGTWGSYALSGSSNNGTYGADCNGEILVLPATRQSDGAEVFVALQSIPFGTSRSNVGIYYKELASADAFSSPAVFAAGWTKGLQLSTLGSAYSTMVVQSDRRIGFYYEEETFGAQYTEVYRPLTLEEITGEAYSYNPAIDPQKWVGGGTGSQPTSSLPQAGKIYTIRCVGYSGVFINTEFSYYLTTEGDAFKAVKASDAPAMPTDNYYWMLCQDPGTGTYYLSSVAGNGYLGRLDLTSDATAAAEGAISMSGFTNRSDGALAINGFETKWGTKSSTQDISEGGGCAIRFTYSDGAERVLSVSQNGALDRMDYTTTKYAPTFSTTYYTTKFIFTEVDVDESASDNGTFSAPKYSGFPVTFTRSSDGQATGGNADYEYWATLKLPFATRLPSVVDEAYGVEANPADLSTGTVYLRSVKDELSDELSVYKVLPRETPVLLKVKQEDGERLGGTADNDYKFTLRLRPTQAQPMVETGLRGTLSRETFSELHDNTTPETYYILGKQGGEVAFYYLNNKAIAANKAYFVFANNGGTAAAVLNFVADSSTTGLQPAPVQPADRISAPLYDLTGRRVTHPVKGGLYIQSGRKFIMR